ncbi:MAG TPA: type II toxin-antitoxin system VapC family toxin [Blastocatellia bacterium]|nr:type II toxin-antitoxin system VapC family toxin [Blastocatellia bacterium]
MDQVRLGFIKMEDLPVRANCFDASALVKVFSDEEGSEFIREFFHNHASTRYTTPFCFYEALSVLKVKWLYRKEITESRYRESAFQLTAWYASSLTSTKDIDFYDPIVFNRVRMLAEKFLIDLSDAFQIESVMNGYFSHLIDESSTLLVTADKNLAEVARKEGIKAWYFLTEAIPI